MPTPLILGREALEGRPPTEACDCWALGCCLYQFLTGRPPFQVLAPDSTWPPISLSLPLSGSWSGPLNG